tara:strand:+ start:69 stop:992 length:924 start_codon:yes stop_codon:yes gene_type:complete
MMNSRQEIIEEQILREQIRKVIRIVKGRKKVQRLNEEKELRSVLRKIILSEAGAMDPVDTAPRSNSTVKNHLEELFQNTIKQVLDDYEALGEKEEREGFFAGFLAGLRNKFDEFDGITDTTDAGEVGALAEAIDIDIEDDEGPMAPDVFIPGGEDSDLTPEEEPLEDEGPVVAPEEQTPEYKLGYNIAQETLPKVETQVMKGYEQFAKVGDQQRANVYKDWAIINYGLHMINKEKLITGEFPEMPADFAAELEKFREAGGTEGAPLEGGAELPPPPPGEAPLPPEGAPLPPEEAPLPPLEESIEIVG